MIEYAAWRPVYLSSSFENDFRADFAANEVFVTGSPDRGINVLILREMASQLLRERYISAFSGPQYSLVPLPSIEEQLKYLISFSVSPIFSRRLLHPICGYFSLVVVQSMDKDN